METQRGVFRQWMVYLFGERTQRLRESTTGAHVLSYLLVTVQSAAVVLALGHQQLQLLLSGDPAITLIAGLAVFLLVASVVAADLCLLATLQRLPVLARNRSNWALLAHLAYLAFVLLVEGSTLALVLSVLDTEPHALISSAPIIPATGWLFAAMIAARAVLTTWTAVQLWIVRGKLPPQWSTLLLEARELLGGKAQSAMSSLNLEGASLSALFKSYASMSRPPSRIARWWNRGLIAREQAALTEEDRQRELVVEALSAFDPRATVGPAYVGHVPLPPGRVVSADEAGPPADGNVTPITSRRGRRSARTRAEGSAALRGARTPRQSFESLEPTARKVWREGLNPEALRIAMSQAAGREVSMASAQKYHAMFTGADSPRTPAEEFVAVGQ